MLDTAAFNARATFTWEADRLYRVCIEDGALYFIRIGGQGGMNPAVAANFGLLGALVVGAAKSISERKRQERLAAQEQQRPQDLLSAHKHNFRLSPSDVMDSSIEPAASALSHGPNAGRWLLTQQDGKKWSLQFESVDDMQAALEVLPVLFGSRLRVNVQWNEKKKRFERQ